MQPEKDIYQLVLERIETNILTLSASMQEGENCAPDVCDELEIKTKELLSLVGGVLLPGNVVIVAYDMILRLRDLKLPHPIKVRCTKALDKLGPQRPECWLWNVA